MSTEGGGSLPQPPAPTTKEAFKPTAVCIFVCVCVYKNTRQRSKNRRRACEGTQKKKCTAEVHGRNKEKKMLKPMTFHCRQGSGNSCKIYPKLRKKIIFTFPPLTLWKEETIKKKQKTKKRKSRKKAVLYYSSTQMKKKKKNHTQKEKKLLTTIYPTKLPAYILSAKKFIYLRVFQVSGPPCVFTSFIFHGAIGVLPLPSVLSAARECGPQSTVTPVCGGVREARRHDGGRVSPSGE
ncbi:hypothetical protein MOQ_006582 [Trypanosoma cruzi marinkellei]|uniref:Uncharacterized protein n=1 Tax=Trypanosoma cruzi marinkellei TaxID=85056 RepID=K2NL79_TRYCR|nr:hypothetical protein MOQ_006582 [Trypanosoma cruzi marinkellei]